MTIKDLAAMTGYSVGTVSRVLNNHPNVSDTARETILRAVEECGFQLNTNAKQLKQQHSNSILVVVKGTFNELFGELIEVIQSQIARTSYSLHVDYMDEDANEVLRAVQLCREKKPLGIMFLGGNRHNFAADFSKIDVPCVLVTNNAEALRFPNLSSVSTDDRAAARCAVDHLISLGHSRIGLLGGNWDCAQIAYSRVQGWQDSMWSHGLHVDEGMSESCRYSMQDGYEAVGRLLARNPDLTAIFAVSDVMAMGIIRALQDLGKRVPEDISVVGYDGIAMGSFTIPRLTTIRQDTQRLAEQSVDILLKNIQRKHRPVHERIPFQLMPGESAGKREG